MSKHILVFGGRADERMVSVASAQGLSQKHDFDECWFVKFEGPVVRTSREEIVAHKNPFKTEFSPRENPFSGSLKEALSGVAKDTAFFLGFHGTDGEDGAVQLMMEKAGLAFTGSDSKASALCFDKVKTKVVAREKGLRLAPELLLPNGKDHAAALTRFFEENGKIVVKPNANGSSIGLFIVHDRASLEAAQKGLKSTKEDYIAEKFIVGRELTVTALERGPKRELMALPASEVVLDAGGSFDYDGKYLGKGTTEITPAKISAEEMKLAQDVALKAHQVLGCYGYSRTDMILTSSGIVFLETNTLPGLTSASFVPQQLAAAGMQMSDFIRDQLALARSRV